MSAPPITLLTDFGLRDGYVGAMKGVLLTRSPGVQLVDLSHEIPPGAIDAGAYVLAQAALGFPEGTVHLAVVDPGVGSSRRAAGVTSTSSGYRASWRAIPGRSARAIRRRRHWPGYSSN